MAGCINSQCLEVTRSGQYVNSPGHRAGLLLLRTRRLLIAITIRARAEGHLFAGNDQVFNWYFWKGPTLGYSKQDFLKWGSGGLGFY